jgi:hypothetical protein
MAEAATMFTVTPVAHPRDSVVIGGLHTRNFTELLVIYILYRCGSGKKA